MRLTLQEVYDKFANNIYQTAFSVCGSRADAEDVLQEVLIRYYRSDTDFNDLQHIRAWLLRVTANQAKNVRRTFWNRNRVCFEDYMESESAADNDTKEILSALSTLTAKERIAVHLHYYEGYSTKEIANILQVPEGTVKSRMHKARKKLKEVLSEEWEDE